MKKKILVFLVGFVSSWAPGLKPFETSHSSGEIAKNYSPDWSNSYKKYIDYCEKEKIDPCSEQDWIGYLSAFSLKELQIYNSDPRAKTCCAVWKDSSNRGFGGSGTYVSVNGFRCILTSSHIGNIKFVVFSYSNGIGLADYVCEVENSHVFGYVEKEAEKDLQICTLRQYPKNLEPVKIDLELDWGLKKDIAIFGFGTLFSGPLFERQKNSSIMMKKIESKLIFTMPIAKRSYFSPWSIFYNLYFPNFEKSYVRHCAIESNSHPSGGFSGCPIFQKDKICGVLQSSTYPSLITKNGLFCGVCLYIGGWAAADFCTKKFNKFHWLDVLFGSILTYKLMEIFYKNCFQVIDLSNSGVIDWMKSVAKIEQENLGKK